MSTTNTTALLLGLSAALAQAGEPSVSLREADAVERAVARSEELAALERRVEEQQERADYAGHALDNPVVRVRDVSTKYADPDANQELQVGLRWNPPKLGELSVRGQKERVELWKRKVKAHAFRMALVAHVRETYARVAILQERVELSREQVDLRQKLATTLERLVSLGHRQLVDQIKAERRSIATRGEASRLRQRLSGARRELRALVGEADGSPTLRAEPADLPTTFEQLHARAMEHRPEAGLAVQRHALTDLEYDAERLELIPWPSFVELVYHAESERADWGELRLGVELPLFNWNLGELRATARASDGIAASDAAPLEELDNEIRTALLRYRQAAAEWRSLAADAGAFVPRTQHLLDQARQQDALPADELLELELAALAARQMLLEARMELHESAVALCRAVGVERWQDLLSPAE
jgi:outer membrane protein TolC